MARYLFTVLLALGLALGMAQDDQQQQTETQLPGTGQTISDYLQSAEDLLTMRAAVNASEELSQTLSSEGTYTLFAPNNQAFSVITQEQLDAIVGGESSIGHYVVQGTLTQEVLQGMLQARGGQMSLETLGGSPLSFTLDDQGTVTVGGVAQIGEGEIVANGVVIPMNNIVAAQEGGEVAGGGEAGGQEDFTGQSIADVLLQNVDLEAMRAAVNASEELSQTLSSEGVYTLFAPTNEAFSMLAQEQFDAIVGGQSNLQSYVVEGAALTTDVLQGMLQARGGQMDLETLGGGTLSFTLDDEGVVVGGVARLVESQIVGNGVVQQVDNVLPTAQGGEQEGGVAGGGEGEQTDETQEGVETDETQQEGEPVNETQQEGVETDGAQEEGEPVDETQEEGEQTDETQQDGQ